MLTGNERKPAAALVPRVISNIKETARRNPLGRANGTAAQAVVGDPRSRADAGRFGMLWLTALTFSMTNKVQAADPDVTFLDDDRITYKDLEHGAFELVTKEAIPRHFIVEDPGQTIVLHRQGSSVNVNAVMNSAARMAELQAAQQEALATAEKGPGATGSSTPPFLAPLQAKPINFIQIEEAIPAQNSLTMPPLLFTPPPEDILGKIPPLPPTLNAASGPTEIDTVVFDVFTATSGTFVASSSNSNATLTFGISGGSTGSTVLDGVTYDVSKAGPYGTLYVNSTTGAYTFVPNSDAINALTAPTTTNFVITVSDGTLSASQTFTIAINGANDAAVISGATSGAVIEAGGVANATPGSPTATGILTDTDVDNPPNTFTAVTSPKASAGGYGTFTMTAAGVWAYTLNNASSAVQALNAGDTLIDTFTVTTIDGTPQVVTITIHGAGDAAIISGTTTGSVVEAGGVANAAAGTPTATGTLSNTDVDNASDTFTAVSAPAASDGGYGTFTMTTTGVWTYTLNNANSAVQALNVGNTLTDTFTITTIDGTAQVVTITIAGTNDAAVISGTATGSVIEAGGVANATLGTPTATGTLTDADPDNAPNSFTAISSPKASAGGYGSFTMTAAGVWIYTVDNANSAVQALNVGGTLTDTFTVTTVDGTAQGVTITITGTNDAAIISGTSTGSVIEAGATPGVPKATGTLTDTDVDNAPNTFTAVSAPAASDGGYGTFTMTAAGVWTYTLDDTNSVVQALDVGDTLTDTFTVTSIDGTARVVTIAIHGASDADPNDFDNLALGTAVSFEPPNIVHGTPGHDSIAGGGDEGQIIYGGAADDTLNGTGKADTIYAGSGNDTVKGNDGDDTIYGGSGSDTINANNGNDTIIGGFGADFLTGSNGDDTFVYLSAVDSNRAQFDIISDFRSGADKIDLTALGALAFLALTSNSTSVPAHTVAWRYDSASNETIVYVNPTDQTLSIGDSSLVEIHLQGIATVQPSDFITQSAAAPVVAAEELISPELTATVTQEEAAVATTAGILPDSPLNDGTLVANGSWTPQTTGVDGSHEAVRNHNDSIDYSKFASFSFDQIPTQPTELTDDGSGAPAGGAAIDAKAVHTTMTTEQNFALNQQPVLDTALYGTHVVAMNDDIATSQQIDDGHPLHENSRAVHAHTEAPSQSATHSNIAWNNENQGQGHGAKPPVANDVAIDDDPNGHASHANSNSHHSASDEPNKHDTASKQEASEFEPSTTAATPAPAAAHMHGLGGSFHFKENISSAGAPAVVEDTEVSHIAVSIGHPAGAADPNDLPAISEIAQPTDHANFGHAWGHMGHTAAHAAHELMV